MRKLRLERLRQLRDHAPARGRARAGAAALPRSSVRASRTRAPRRRSRRRRSTTSARFMRGAFVPGRFDARDRRRRRPSTSSFAAARSGVWRLGDARRTHRRSTATPDSTPPPLVPERRLAIVPRAGAAQSELRIGHVCASRDTPDYHALVLLNMILGGQFVSRVNLNLRQDKGYTYGVRTGFDLRRGLGPFVLQTSVQTEVTAAAIREVAAGARRYSRRAAGHGRRTGAGARVGHARAIRAASRPRSRWRAASRSWRCTACPTPTSRSSCRASTRSREADVSRVAPQYLDPARMVDAGGRRSRSHRADAGER